MTTKNSNLKTKALLLSSSLLILSFLASCSDSKNNENDKSNHTKSAQVLEGSKIEVVKNESARELKVETGDANKSKNDSFYYDYGEKSAYDQNAQPANSDASVRVRPRSAIDANMNVRSPYEEVQISMIVNNLSKKFMVKCSACHNDYANGIIGPSLIGRDSEYIYGKITAFKSGEKKNVLMKDLINMMDDKEIRDMADEIYKFNQEIKKIRDK
jgi:cytochrome c553